MVTPVEGHVLQITGGVGGIGIDDETRMRVRQGDVYVIEDGWLNQTQLGPKLDKVVQVVDAAKSVFHRTGEQTHLQAVGELGERQQSMVLVTEEGVMAFGRYGHENIKTRA